MQEVHLINDGPKGRARRVRATRVRGLPDDARLRFDAACEHVVEHGAIANRYKTAHQTPTWGRLERADLGRKYAVSRSIAAKSGSYHHLTIDVYRKARSAGEKDAAVFTARVSLDNNGRWESRADVLHYVRGPWEKLLGIAGKRASAARAPSKRAPRRAS